MENVRKNKDYNLLVIGKKAVFPGISMVPGFCITLLLAELFEVLDSLSRNHEKDCYFSFSDASMHSNDNLRNRRNASPRNFISLSLEKVKEEESDDEELELKTV